MADCNHDSTTSKRFNGDVTCDKCMVVIGYWKGAQNVLNLNKESK